MVDADERLLGSLWRALGGSNTLTGGVRLSGPAPAIVSRYALGDLAAASVAVATLAAAELWAHRTGSAPRDATVSRAHAWAAFRCERLLTAEGWTLPPVWDPLAGDYATSDGWVRLHTNYAWHRDAALRALSAPADKAALAASVRERTAEEVETAVVSEGGCAAALRTSEAWAAHPQGRAVAGEPLVAYGGSRARELERAPSAAPLAGLRVLDLTRVIAGPVCTRFLAAFGASVLRIDPPGFDEVPLLLPETTRGKRCAFLDLRAAEGRARFDALLAEADVLVHGHRPGTLERLGYGADRLTSLNASLVTVRLDAYGHTGPWSGRRGFDSLVQMSTGIAAPGADGRPSPLPAQALDHATGYLLAAAACRALVGGHADARLSLARVARLLVDLGPPGVSSTESPPPAPDGTFLEGVQSAWGPLRTVRVPGGIAGFVPPALLSPGPLGRDAARFEGTD